MNEECEKFSNIKSSASGVLPSIYFIFCQFQPGVAYKSVAYKKSMYSEKISMKYSGHVYLEVSILW